MDAVDEVETISQGAKSPSKPKREKEAPSISTIDILRIVVGLVLLQGLLSYFITGDSFVWNYRAWWLRPKALAAKLRSPVILTDTQLLSYNGEDESLPIYLAVNGTIYDVSTNPRVYGPGGPYHFFAGHDATRGYITGCFQEDSVRDYRGAEWTFVPKDVPPFDEELSPEREEYRIEMVGRGLEEVDGTIRHWQKVFTGGTGKEYFEVGYVKRKPGWLKTETTKTLCERGEKKRPKPQFDKFEKSDKSAIYQARGQRAKEEYLHAVRQKEDAERRKRNEL